MADLNVSQFRRFLFDNLVIKVPNSQSQYLLLNLRSYRREIINENDYFALCSAEDAINSGMPISKAGLDLYQRLLRKKQILTSEQRKEYDDKRRIVFQQQVKEVSPLITDVTISPTFSCNFKCTYCYQRHFTGKDVYMNRTDIDQICEYICALNGTENFFDGIRSVTINGGECCQAESIDVLNYIFEKFGQNPSCMFKLYTNGSQIIQLKDQIDFHKFIAAQISLDGYDEIIPMINGVKGPVFNSVISGIKYIAEICKSVRIMCMLTPTILERMDKFIDALKKEGILDYDNITVDFAAISNFQKETIDSRFLSLEAYAQAKKRFRAANYPSNVRFNLVYEAQRISSIVFRSSPKAIARDHTCNIFEARNIMFAPGGKVYWCICTNQETGETGNYKNLTQYDRERFIQRLNRSTNLMPKCNECQLKYVCGGGCALFAVAQNKRPNEGYCGLFSDPYFMDHLEDFL